MIGKKSLIPGKNLSNHFYHILDKGTFNVSTAVYLKVIRNKAVSKWQRIIDILVGTS